MIFAVVTDVTLPPTFDTFQVRIPAVFTVRSYLSSNSRGVSFHKELCGLYWLRLICYTSILIFPFIRDVNQY